LSRRAVEATEELRDLTGLDGGDLGGEGDVGRNSGDLEDLGAMMWVNCFDGENSRPWGNCY
jgi:hypothetical protein